MTEIPLSSGALTNPLVIDVGLLTSLLSASGSETAFNLDWFQDPLANIKAITSPAKRADLLKLLSDILPPASATAPDTRNWYPLEPNGVASHAYVVLPADDSGTTSIVGVGIWKSFTEGAITIDAWAYFPLFELPIDAAVVVTGTPGFPVEAAIRVKSSSKFTAGPVSFDGLQYQGSIYFSGSTPVFELDFTNMTPASEQSVVKAVGDLMGASPTAWVNAVLASETVESWLAETIGSSDVTIGKVLSTIGILEGANDSYTLADLTPFTKMSPMQLAESLIADTLQLLASNTKPIVPVKDGGVYVTSEAGDAGATLYGLRLQIPNIDVSPKDPSAARALVQIGALLSDDTSAESWLTRGSPNRTFGEPGVVLGLISIDAAKVPSFKPRVELNSIGVDLAGANAKPLIDVEGVKLDGFEVRTFVSLDFADLGAIPWGAAIRCDNVGLPLANGLGSTASNPVAQALLSSGNGGGDTSAVNPTFSAAVCKIIDPTNATTMEAWFDAPSGGVAQEVWLPVQGAFGPLHCKRLGVSWPTPNDDRSLWFLFDGDVSLGPLDIALFGLSLGIPLAAMGNIDRYHLGLQGLGLTYSAGPLEISGGLVETHTTVNGADFVSYDGEALIKAESWSVAAVGSFGSMNGHPSLFVFAFLEAAIGGPPVLFVTGLSAGFGYNRSLRLPGQDEVASFPLVAGLSDPSAIGGSTATPAEALQALDAWVQPAQGQNWFAAGVQFTSFELVHSNVLVVVQPSLDFQITMLGLSRIKFPQSGSLTFGYAELDIKATFSPADGSFIATAVLSPNSYVLDTACHLTGGFAFAMWFGNDHPGDFVITLGGYHPAFQKPDWYPDVPRLGFSWQVSSDITIQGGAYFALTPSCVMGGGSLDVEFHSGDLHAWFTAHADFLLHWKPFYYLGSVGVSIGASYKLDLLFTSVTVSVSLGADLDVWGPPTGGVVHIDWYIISFSVSFGADRLDTADPIPWSEFQSLLPQNKPAPALHSAMHAARVMALEHSFGDSAPALMNVCKITIADGLLRQVTTSNGVLWLVRADEIALGVETAFPVTEVDLGGSAKIVASGYSAVAVRPMGEPGLSSAMTITLSYDGGAATPLGKGWTYLSLNRALPEAMWGAPLAKGIAPPPAANTVPGLLVGVAELMPMQAAPTGPPQMDASAIAHAAIDLVNSNWLPLNPAASPVTRAPTLAPTSLSTISSTIGSGPVVQNRAELFSALASLGIDAGVNGDVSAVAAGANYSYPAPPMLWEAAS